MKGKVIRWMKARKRIVVIGDVFADMVAKVKGFPEKGGRTFGTPFTRNGGGTGGNIASGLAALGMDTTIVCGIGDDETGDFLLEGLREEGVDISYVRQKVNLKSGLVPILLDEDGERNIYALVQGSAYEYVETEDVLFLEEMKPDVLCFTGVIMGAHPVQETVLETARRWKGRAEMYFDPNLCYPANAVPDKVKEASRQLAGYCDVVLTGKVEMQALSLHPKKGQIYIVKSGREGSTLLDESGEVRYHIPATRHQPIDTTGAGDTFMAAFVTHRTEGHSVKEAMKYATVAAGIAVTKKGARNMPSAEAIDAYLKIYERDCRPCDNVMAAGIPPTVK